MRQVAHITAVMVNRLFSSPFDVIRKTEKTEATKADFNITHNGFPAIRNFEKFFGDNGLYFSYFNEVCDDIRTEL
jgi:hypothetical protein